MKVSLAPVARAAAAARPNRAQALRIMGRTPAASLRTYVVTGPVLAGRDASALRQWLIAGPREREVQIVLRNVGGDQAEAEQMAAALRRHRGHVRILARGANGPAGLAILASGDTRAASPEVTFAPPAPPPPRGRLTAPTLRALACTVTAAARVCAARLGRHGKLPRAFVAIAGTGRVLSCSDLLDAGLVDTVLFT